MLQQSRATIGTRLLAIALLAAVPTSACTLNSNNRYRSRRFNFSCAAASVASPARSATCISAAAASIRPGPPRGGAAARRTRCRNFGSAPRSKLPNPTLADQLDLPKDQGIVVSDVLPDSAASKAGLKAHDIVLELDGKTVSSKLSDFSKQVGDIKADMPVDVVVLRRGKRETVKGLSLPEPPPQLAPAAPAPNAPKTPAKPAAPGIF